MTSWINIAKKNNFVILPLSGKRPIVKNWQNFSRSFEDSFEKAKKFRTNNIGILCGSVSGITVIDIDSKSRPGSKSGFEFYGNILREFNNFEHINTLTVLTGNNGLHVYFKYTSLLRTSVGLHGTTIDIRSDGSQVVFPPSIHPDTKIEYKFGKIEDIVEIPKYLLERLIN